MSRTPLFTLRFDPGWLYVIAGSAMCAATILVPSENDLDDLRAQRDELREQDAALAGRLEAHAELLDQIEAADPMLIKRLAASQLNRIADGAEPRVLATRAPGDRGDWIDAATRRLPVGPIPVVTATPERTPSLLSRLADGPHRLWILGGSVMCIFVGLLMTPEPRRDRAAGPLVADQGFEDAPRRASDRMAVYIEDDPPPTEPTDERVRPELEPQPETPPASSLLAIAFSEPAAMLFAPVADDEADIIEEDELDECATPEPPEMTASQCGLVDGAVNTLEIDEAIEMPPVEIEDEPVEELVEEEAGDDVEPDDDDEYEYEYVYVDEDGNEVDPDDDDVEIVAGRDEEDEEDEDYDDDDDEDYEDEDDDEEDEDYEDEDDDEEDEDYEDEDDDEEDEEYEDADDEDDDDADVVGEDDDPSVDDEDDDEYEYVYEDDEDEDDDDEDAELVDADADGDSDEEYE